MFILSDCLINGYKSYSKLLILNNNNNNNNTKQNKQMVWLSMILQRLRGFIKQWIPSDANLFTEQRLVEKNINELSRIIVRETELNDYCH